MKMCSKCILPVGYPGVQFVQTADGIKCQWCAQEEKGQARERALEEMEKYLRTLVSKRKHEQGYDAVVAISGGKDSTAALYLAVKKYGLKVLAFTVDNGVKSDKLITNICKIVNWLSVDWQLVRHDLSKSLKRYLINCQYPCGKECNVLQDHYFGEMAHIHGVNTVISGYELLGRGGKAVISKDGYMLVNVLAALRLTDAETKRIAYEAKWTNPSYFVGHDALPGFSDCLAGAVALERIYSQRGLGFDDILSGRYETELLPYLAKRVRAGIVSKKEMLNLLRTPIKATATVWAEISEKMGGDLLGSEKG